MDSSMTTKRKHKTLTLEEKCEVLKLLDSGRSVSELATAYDVGKSTISDIRKKRSDILKFVTTSDSGPKRKTLKTCDNPDVESVLYAWFLQERSRRAHISGDVLCEKARYFYQQITGKDDFKASSGWLDNFKKRHGIRQLSVFGEKLYSGVSEVQLFQREFLQKTYEMNLVPDQVYSANESGLFWRILPNKILNGQRAIPECRDRIIFMPCASSTGNHKLKLFVLGKTRKPWAFKNCGSLPVVYRTQAKSCITRELFSEWFHHEFVPSVRRKLSELHLPQKALLVLDNARGYLGKEELASDDNQIQAMFLPPNYIPLLQPMDQNVIQDIKLRYRKSLLMSIVASNKKDVAQILRNLDLKTALYSLRDSWLSVKTELIQKSWKKLWPTQKVLTTTNVNIGRSEEGVLLSGSVLNRSSQEENERSVQEDNNDLYMMTDVLNKVFEMQDQITPNEVKEWVVGRSEDVVDKEIIENVKVERDDDKEEEDKLDISNLITHKEAVTALETCLQWSSENNVPVRHILLLRKIREQAFKAHLRELK